MLVAPMMFRAPHVLCEAGLLDAPVGGGPPASRTCCVLLLGYRTKRVGFMVTFRLFGAEKSVLKLVGANLKDGQNVLVL